MPRWVFTGQVDPDRLPEYRERHAAVWPEVLLALREAGWGDYTLHLRDDGLLVGVVDGECSGGLEQLLAAMEGSPANARWQAEMAAFFVAPRDGRPDRSFTPLPAVFDLVAQLRRTSTP